MLLGSVLLTTLQGCRAPSKFDDIVLSYSESNTFCLGCPRFRVDFSSGGHVNYECFGSCAVPGQQHHIVPAERFRELVQAFHDAGFFKIPRTDRNKMVADATVIRLTYRDERRIHEVVDAFRQIPKITDLETRLKAATEVDRYLKPSLALYRSLVDSGWDVNILGPDQQNALFSAVVFRDLQSTRFLLRRGSKVTDYTLELAPISENVDILHLVLRASHVKLSGEPGARILERAAGSRKTDLLQFLLDPGADINSHHQARTPLTSSVASGSFENAKLLLSRGADANGRDNSGRTALWYAAISENTGFITLLLEHGSDVNARDEAGRTALMNAADICYTWDVRALLDGGADPTLVDKRGRTALEPQLTSVGNPKCATAHGMIEVAVRSWAGRQQR